MDDFGESKEFADLLAHESMADLAMKMDAIDKQLEDLATIDTSKSNFNVGPSDKHTDNNDHGDAEDDYEGENGIVIKSPIFSDMSERDYDYDDDDFENENEALALDSLKEELQNFESAAEDFAKARTRAITEGDPIKEDNGVTTRKFSHMIESTIKATVTKPTPKTPLGIAMKTERGVTTIVEISKSGLLKDTKLKPGYEILQINSTKVKNAKHARGLICHAKQKVTIVTRMVVQLDDVQENEY